MKTNVVKNYFLNLIYQVFLLIMPLVVTPYVSRILQENGIGIYSFSYSIASYFVIFGALGFNYYSQRKIAQKRENLDETRNFFWSIITIRFFTVSISIVVYLLLILLNVFSIQYKKILLIMLLNIVSLYFDISFYFQGKEKFANIVIRNVIIKIIGIACVFLFVKSSNDLWKYALIQSFIVLISNISLWLCIPKEMLKIKQVKISIKCHIKPMFRLFIPTIAATIFTLMDRLLIGILVSGEVEVDGVIKQVCDIENGMYDQSEKIITMGSTILTALGIVMIPHNSKMISDGNIEGVKNNIYKSLKFVFFLGFPIAGGLFAVSSNFSPWFFGVGYDKVPYLLKIFSCMIIFVGLVNVYGVQFMIPLGKDCKYTISICIGAMINLILDVILIYNFQSYGAAIATVIGEFVVSLSMMLMSRKEISVKLVLLSGSKYFISAMIMTITVFLISSLFSSSILNTFILIIIGIIIYFSILLLLKDEFILLFVQKIKNKIKKKDNENG